MEHKTKKCPHCGSNIDFLATKCSYCGKDVELASKAIDKQQVVDNIFDDTNKLNTLKPASVFDLLLKNLILVLLLSLPIAFIAAFTDSFIGKMFSVTFP